MMVGFVRGKTEVENRIKSIYHHGTSIKMENLLEDNFFTKHIHALEKIIREVGKYFDKGVTFDEWKDSHMKHISIDFPSCKTKVYEISTTRIYYNFKKPIDVDILSNINDLVDLMDDVIIYYNRFYHPDKSRRLYKCAFDKVFSWRFKIYKYRLSVSSILG